ncbi:MAG TPA: GNAT family N-acetyltransferase, partial [Chitinophagaceae bacterium]|nr:GNAT family N-acetyltransferase [Chitinophagaceae bacterium]
MSIKIAHLADAPDMVKLINSAYRGEISKKGWTTEADIIGGEFRILLPDLEALIQKPSVVFLLSVNEEQRIEGSVFLEKRGDQLYLGMLSVDPVLQTRGTGKQLMLAAEEQAR